MTVVRAAGIVLTIAAKTLFYSKKRSGKSAPFHFGERDFTKAEHSISPFSPLSSVGGDG